MQNNLRNLFQLPVFLVDGFFYHISGSIITPKPRMVQFPVCDRCNARCIMCNRWKKNNKTEISIETIQEVFRGDLFSKVEEVCLHGGEPTLRNDLADICSIIQESCKKIKRLWISTNGFGPRRIEKRIQEILSIIHFEKIHFLEINVSIDGLETTHEKIRGVKGGFKQSIETIQILLKYARDYPVKVSIGTVIQPLNLYELNKIEKLAKNLGVPILFQPIMFDRFFNINGNTDLKFGKNEKNAFKEIIEKKFVNGLSTTCFYWRDLRSMIDGAKRKSPCAFDRYVFSLYPTGEVLPCSREDWIVFGNVNEESPKTIWFSPRAKEIRRKMRKEVCPTCSSYCAVEFSLQKEFFKYLKFYLKNILFDI